MILELNPIFIVVEENFFLLFTTCILLSADVFSSTILIKLFLLYIYRLFMARRDEIEVSKAKLQAFLDTLPPEHRAVSN